MPFPTVEKTRPVEEIIQPSKNVASTISGVAFTLQSTIQNVLDAHENEADAVLALQRDGLADAVRFVKPMQMIRMLPMDSPLRQLQVFQMACLYSENEKTMRQVLDFIDDEMRRGIRTAVSIQTGIIKTVQFALKARANREKELSGTGYSRGANMTDLYQEVGRLRERLERYEGFLSDLAAESGADSPDDLIATFYAPSEVAGDE